MFNLWARFQKKKNKRRSRKLFFLRARVVFLNWFNIWFCARTWSAVDLVNLGRPRLYALLGHQRHTILKSEVEQQRVLFQHLYRSWDTLTISPLKNQFTSQSLTECQHSLTMTPRFAIVKKRSEPLSLLLCCKLKCLANAWISWRWAVDNEIGKSSCDESEAKNYWRQRWSDRRRKTLTDYLVLTRKASVDPKF